jgi:F0F1-type ATP synthase assembly protein I
VDRGASAGQHSAAGERGRLYSGFGDALGLAVELAGVTVVFALLGLWLDSRFGTRPAFLLVGIVFAVVGLGVRAYYTYSAQMAREEEGKPWARRP